MTERLTFGKSAAFSLTHFRLGTGSFLPIVTDRLATVVKSANRTYSSVCTESITVVMSKHRNVFSLVVLSAYGTVESSIALLRTSGRYNSRGGVVSKRG